jgi:hypothetical protein
MDIDNEADVEEGGLAAWRPVHPLLAFCTGSPRVYFWMQSPQGDDAQAGLGGTGASRPKRVTLQVGTEESDMRVDTARAETFWVDLPPGYNINAQMLRWSPDGVRLIISGKDSSCSAQITLGFGDALGGGGMDDDLKNMPDTFDEADEDEENRNANL